MLRAILLLPLIFGGTVGVVVFSYHSLVDWNALQQTYLSFEELAQSSANLNALFTAQAQQNIHRINLFAEGVWALQSATIAAIGIHGLCASRRTTNH